MTPEIFLAQFGHIADSPNGVQKLRELVLGFAITGKLFPQNDTDTPARDAIKSELGFDQSRYAALLSEFSLPPTWEWCQISSVCDLRTGATPSRAKPEYFGGDIRWLVSGDIHKREIFDCEGRVTETGLSNSNCKILPENSVLIALNGQGKTRATVAILRVPAACNQSLVSMTPKSPKVLLPEFLYLNLRYRYFEIREITGQKQRRGLNMKLVGALSVSIPPIEEQKRIVAKVDQLMALCDRLAEQQKKRAEIRGKAAGSALDALVNSENSDDFDANWQRIAANVDRLIDSTETLKALRSTILDLAVRGKLVSQNSNDKPASELLEYFESIRQTEKKASKLANSGSELAITHDLPHGWEWTRTAEVCELITDGEHSTPRRTANRNAIPLVTAKNVRDGDMDYANTDFVPIDVAEKCWVRCKPKVNDILMVSVGATLGRLTILRDSKDMVLVRSVTLLRPILAGIDVNYLALHLNSPMSQAEIWESVRQNAQPCLYLGKSSALNIALPPIEEQKRIVAKVDQLMAVCDQLEAQLASRDDIGKKLAASFTHHLLAA